MNITDLIVPERVFAGVHASNKTQLLRDLALRASKFIGLNERTVLDALNAREQLGSTGVGEGIAIPHARIDGLSSFFALFIRLDRPIDFAAIDGQPIDLVFLLLSPAGSTTDHLAALACVSRRLRDREVAHRLRAAKQPTQVYEALTKDSVGESARP
jgi:nitrogen PTS system EIIA component